MTDRAIRKSNRCEPPKNEHRRRWVRNQPRTTRSLQSTRGNIMSLGALGALGALNALREQASRLQKYTQQEKKDIAANVTLSEEGG